MKALGGGGEVKCERDCFDSVTKYMYYNCQSLFSKTGLIMIITWYYWLSSNAVFRLPSGATIKVMILFSCVVGRFKS